MLGKITNFDLFALCLGAFGVDFSVPSDHDTYEKDLLKVNRGLLKYGTTSYCPTIVSSSASVYHQVNNTHVQKREAHRQADLYQFLPLMRHRCSRI